MYVCVCMYVCMYVCAYVCMYVCMYICIHVYMYTCMYISRIKDHRLPKFMLYGELTNGHRDKRATRKKYKDSLKKCSFEVCCCVPLS